MQVNPASVHGGCPVLDGMKWDAILLLIPSDIY